MCSKFINGLFSNIIIEIDWLENELEFVPGDGGRGWGGEEEYFLKFVGCATCFFKLVPIFPPKYAIFPTPFQTWFLKISPLSSQNGKNLYPISDKQAKQFTKFCSKSLPVFRPSEQNSSKIKTISFRVAYIVLYYACRHCSLVKISGATLRRSHKLHSVAGWASRPMHQTQIAKGGRVGCDLWTVVRVFYRRKTSKCDIHQWSG